MEETEGKRVRFKGGRRQRDRHKRNKRRKENRRQRGWQRRRHRARKILKHWNSGEIEGENRETEIKVERREETDRAEETE